MLNTNRLAKNSIVISSLLFLLSGSLPAPAKAPVKAAATAPTAKEVIPESEQAPPAPQATTVSADQSLSSSEYIKLGMPAPERDWSDADMTNAATILDTLAKTGYAKLPRYKSAKSGAVFAQMTSPRNLGMYRDLSLPLEARLPNALNYYAATNNVFKLYLTAFVKNDVRDTDIIELFGSILRSTVMLLELTDELTPTIKKDAPDYQQRMEGLEKMNRGLGSIAMGSLMTLTERQSYQKNELIRLIGYMQETFPSIVKHLPAGARDETLLRLEQMQSDTKLADLQPSLGDLQTRIKAAL